MRSSLSHRLLAGAAAAAVLTLALGAGGAGAQVQQRPAGPAGVLTNGLADLRVSAGFFEGQSWLAGGVLVVNNAAVADATQVGPKKNLCRFNQFDYQPSNGGNGDAGPSVSKVFRSGTLIHSHAFAAGDLPANTNTNFQIFDLELEEGMNTLRVVMDANKQVPESNENNTFVAKINVKVDCDGDGKVGGVASPVKGLKQAPVKPDPDPAPTRKLRLKPAN